MPFAIEALQSRSKLSNARNRQVAQTLWPEMRQKEERPIAQTAVSTHNIKSAVMSLLARVKSAINRGGGEAAQGPERLNGQDIITANENDDGFLEINIVKRIRTGNKLYIADTTDDQE